MKTSCSSFLLLRHTACVGPGHIEAFAAARGLKFQLLALDAGEPFPPQPETFEAIVVLGGEMNVYEDAEFPFLRAENEFIRRAVERNVPYLGICLGGQLLAKATGGQVTRHPVKEIGPHEIALTNAGKADPLFRDFPERFPFCQWHGDTFSELPPGATLLATGAACVHQAFRCGQNAYGLQFHPETTPALLEDWCSEFGADLETREQGELLRQKFAACADECQRQCDRLLENFFCSAGILD